MLLHSDFFWISRTTGLERDEEERFAEPEMP